MELGIPELVIILVIVVLLWGPGRVAKIGGELGSGIRAFREGLTDGEDNKEDHSPAQTIQPPEEETVPIDPAVEKTTIEKS